MGEVPLSEKEQEATLNLYFLTWSLQLQKLNNMSEDLSARPNKTVTAANTPDFAFKAVHLIDLDMAQVKAEDLHGSAAVITQHIDRIENEITTGSVRASDGARKANLKPAQKDQLQKVIKVLREEMHNKWKALHLDYDPELDDDQTGPDVAEEVPTADF